jgi:hypothetical protein
MGIHILLKKKKATFNPDNKTKSFLLEEFQNVNKEYFPDLLYSDTRSFLKKEQFSHHDLFDAI